MWRLLQNIEIKKEYSATVFLCYFFILTIFGILFF